MRASALPVRMTSSQRVGGPARPPCRWLRTGMIGGSDLPGPAVVHRMTCSCGATRPRPCGRSSGLRPCSGVRGARSRSSRSRSSRPRRRRRSLAAAAAIRRGAVLSARGSASVSWRRSRPAAPPGGGRWCSFALRVRELDDGVVGLRGEVGALGHASRSPGETRDASSSRRCAGAAPHGFVSVRRRVGHAEVRRRHQLTSSASPPHPQAPPSHPRTKPRPPSRASAPCRW